MSSLMVLFRLESRPEFKTALKRGDSLSPCGGVVKHQLGDGRSWSNRFSRIAVQSASLQTGCNYLFS